MAQSEARAWWADVQHLRDDYERTDEARRRADEADLASRRAVRQRRSVEVEISRVHAPRGRHADPPAAPPRPPDIALVPRRVEHADPEPSAVAAPEPRRSPRVRGSGMPGRRTIEIRGRTVPAPIVPRVVEVDRRRPPRRAADRVAARPDRVAMWALLMGLLLILVAIGTAGSPA